ncbi:hypothetical protein LOD99_14942 [Oopsacas minuta]|uniref:Receptor protein-tyrosine kinase n=1 Tax=Oopsacas minuta TaxID=111878 RepID=A0AAV7KGQ3_9METZ|nr:hypothetical protein LOD99_14942 [Oopsacas minuta]
MSLKRLITLLTILVTICVLNNAEICSREGDERTIDIGLPHDVIQVCYNNGIYLGWTYICAAGWNDGIYQNNEVYCKRFGYLEAKERDITITPLLCDGLLKLSALDCIGNETSLTQCNHTKELSACQLVSKVQCQQCASMAQCEALGMCERVNEFKTCLCQDDCINGGFCFEERCVCTDGYSGNSCETRSTTTMMATNATITTTLGPENNTTQISPTNITTENVSTTLPISINASTYTPQSYTNTTTNLTSNTTVFMNSTQTNSTQFPTQDCIEDDCTGSERRKAVRIILSIIFIIFLLLSIVIIVILICCLTRTYVKMRRYKRTNRRIQTLQTESNNLMNSPNQTFDRSAVADSTYFSNVVDQGMEHSERIYEVVPGPEIGHHSLNRQGENNYFELSSNNCIYSGNNTSQQGNCTVFQNNNIIPLTQQEDLTASHGSNVSFYHKLVTQSSNLETISEENDIINKLLRDRKREQLEYIDPPYNLAELSNSIGPRSYEISLDNLKIGDVFATGNFGVICHAVYTSKYGDLKVAIKTLREEVNNDVKVAFIREAAILSQFDHPNILKFIGVVTTVQPHMIVTELLNIELRQYLMQLCHSQEYNYQNASKLQKLLLRFCRDIADGMEHLAMKKFIHRDLAARNILIANDMSCRVADFGMSRDLRSDDYYRSKGGRIPLRWSAPESVLYNRFSEKSDVWAFGMTLYEIWTLGRKPWQENTNEEIVDFIQGGEIPLQPDGCPDDVYSLMAETWKQSADDRPIFTVIKERLNNTVIIIPFTESVAI